MSEQVSEQSQQGCRVAECNLPPIAYGLCSAHRSRAVRRGWKPKDLDAAQLEALAHTVRKITRAADTGVPVNVKIVDGRVTEMRALAPATVAILPVRQARHADIVALARGAATDAIQVIINEMTTADRAADRLKAAELLLNRAELDINSDIPARLMTDDALRRAAAEILSRVPVRAAEATVDVTATTLATTSEQAHVEHARATGEPAGDASPTPVDDSGPGVR